LGSIEPAPPDVDGLCDGVVDDRLGNAGYWFGVKYFGVLFALAMIYLDLRRIEMSHDFKRSSLIPAALVNPDPDLK
jgi:hypothetical protein